MKVHRSLGAGFLEAVYEEALMKEFLIQNIPFKRQLKLELYYDNQKLNKYYRADFVCYDSIILEIKAVTHIPDIFLCTVEKLFEMYTNGVRYVD